MFLQRCFLLRDIHLEMRTNEPSLRPKESKKEKEETNLKLPNHSLFIILKLVQILLQPFILLLRLCQFLPRRPDSSVQVRDGLFEHFDLCLDLAPTKP